MTKILIAFFAFTLSTAAFAMTPDFSVLDHAGNHGSQADMGQCMKNSWKATNPTDAQSSEAQANMDAVKAVFAQHKAAIESDMKAMMAAWGAYPINKADVVAAETTMQGDISPVMSAAQDGQIDTLNLLTADQRATFDQTFKACMQNGN